MTRSPQYQIQKNPPIIESYISARMSKQTKQGEKLREIVFVDVLWL